MNGVTYIHSRWPHGVVPGNQLANLNASVGCFAERFRVYRPVIVVAASKWETALPAWVAAKRMGLPLCFEVRGFGGLANDAREPDYTQVI